MTVGLDQLARRAGCGDRDAFRRLAEDVAPHAHRLAWRLFGDADLAADAVQEFLIKLHRILDGYDPARPFLPWAMTIAGHAARDVWRREHRDRRAPAELVEGCAAPDRERPDRRAETAQLQGALARAAADMSAAQRRVFVLRDLEGWTTAEIAELMECAESTVRVHLARARNRARIALAHFGGTR